MNRTGARVVRQLSLAFAAIAASSISAPAAAAIIPSTYTFTTPTAGSGTFTVNLDTLTGFYSLAAFDYMLGSTTFSTANVSMIAGSTYVIGGNVNGPDLVSSLGGADDFRFTWAPVVFPPPDFTFYIAGGILPEQRSGITFALVPTVGVPEPASWAMMLLGFAGIGAAMRRRKLTEALAN